MDCACACSCGTYLQSRNGEALSFWEWIIIAPSQITEIKLEIPLVANSDPGGTAQKFSNEGLASCIVSAMRISVARKALSWTI